MNKKILIIIVVLILILGVSSIYDLYKNNDEEILNIEENIIENEYPEEWMDNGIFSENYGKAYKKLEMLTTEEKIGQLLLVRYPDNNAGEILKEYKFGGYLLFKKDFDNKTEEDVIQELAKLQEISDIPILIAVDEEGGNVVRVSSNKNLSDKKFKSPMELYKIGGFEEIEKDTIEKSDVLKKLGINLNLAPVVDISTNPKDFIYKRTLGEGSKLTAEYAKTVISSSKGRGVSYTLKHFPGYGNNSDTHTGSAIDNREYEYIANNDLVPFKEGIEAGAEAVLVNHNIVTSIDAENPASLSLNVHKILREKLNFTGIIMTDDISMQAVSEDPEAIEKSILAGNDIMIVTDYKSAVYDIKQALERKIISQKDIDHMVFRILAWKYYKGLIN